MHGRTFYVKRRGDRTITQAEFETGIDKGTLSRIERGEQFPRDGQLAALLSFYDFESLSVYGADAPARLLLERLYPPAVLKALCPDATCACGCGKKLHPDSLRTKRYLDGHRKHRRREEGACPA